MLTILTTIFPLKYTVKHLGSMNFPGQLSVVFYGNVKRVFLTRSHSDTKLKLSIWVDPRLVVNIYEASVGVLCVTLVFRGVKFGQLVTIWNFGVLQSSQISWDWANTIHTVNTWYWLLAPKFWTIKIFVLFKYWPPKVWSRCNLSHFETPHNFSLEYPMGLKVSYLESRARNSLE